MPLDPDKLREASEKGVNLSKRMDAFIERRKINDSADDEDEDEDLDIEPSEEELLEPAEEAMRATPGTDQIPSDPPNDKEPWFS
jgi:hypothetical protein